ncbi:putative aldehyde dehydrogenase FUS7, partial [Lachnellula cervina]
MSPSATSTTAKAIDSNPDTFLKWDGFFNTVDGELLSTKTTRHSINPATGNPNPEVPLSTREDVDMAMLAAQKAFKSWADTSTFNRRAAVLAFSNALEAEKEGFSRLLVQEQGKPLDFARLEIDTSLHWMRTLASFDLPDKKIDDGNKEIITRYIPLGVVVGIVPWNYPILLACGKLAGAVLTGNTIIIKPSPFTPAGDLKLCELAQQFFPPGVVQCLSGDDNLGPWLTEHPIPAKISFTGSSATGKLVMASASKTLKRVTLELGGKDPAIVCEDVDIEHVAQKVAQLAFLNSGQICLAIKRIFVHEKIFDRFRSALIAATNALKVGEGNEPNVFLGPVQNAMQYEKVKGFFNDIEKDGLDVAVGGTNPKGRGYFLTPTIIDRPALESRIVQEEPFGPILPLLSFSTYAQAITLANTSSYGLGASVWSPNIALANEIAQQLEAGS